MSTNHLFVSLDAFPIPAEADLRLELIRCGVRNFHVDALHTDRFEEAISFLSSVENANVEIHWINLEIDVPSVLHRLRQCSVSLPVRDSARCRNDLMSNGSHKTGVWVCTSEELQSVPWSCGINWDFLSIVTTIPGISGRPFVNGGLQLLSEARFMFDKLPLRIDGGMTPSLARDALDLGASHVVSGGYISKSVSIALALEDFQAAGLCAT